MTRRAKASDATSCRATSRSCGSSTTGMTLTCATLLFPRSWTAMAVCEYDTRAIEAPVGIAARPEHKRARTQQHVSFTTWSHAHADSSARTFDGGLQGELDLGQVRWRSCGPPATVFAMHSERRQSSGPASAVGEHAGTFQVDEEQVDELGWRPQAVRWRRASDHSPPSRPAGQLRHAHAGLAGSDGPHGTDLRWPPRSRRTRRAARWRPGAASGWRSGPGCCRWRWWRRCWRGRKRCTSTAGGW